jgi:hypothetical protein
MTAKELTDRLPAKVVVLLAGLAILGGVSLAAGLSRETQRTWIGVLLVSYYLIGVGLAGLLLVAFHYVTGARWSVPILRVPEAMTVALPLAAAGLAAVLVCSPSLYVWWTSPRSDDSPLHHLWLQRPFFLVRALFYVAAWLTFAVAIVRHSRRLDSDDSATQTRKAIRLSAAFLVVFGITYWLASYDWIMSLEPGWASTIFGVYNFAGLFLSGLAAVILLVLWLRRYSLGTVVNGDHLHDLGTLLFSFCSFWMYTWFCQYLLIWYVNNPEETAYLRQRWEGPWPALMLLDVAANWAIPFLILLFRAAKRSPPILGTVAVVILAGRWVDLSLMINPALADGVPIPGKIEIGQLAGTAGLFLLAFFYVLGKAPLVPLQEPLDAEKQ